MTPDTLEHRLPEIISDQEPVLVELSVKEVEAVAGGPQVTNDDITRPG